MPVRGKAHGTDSLVLLWMLSHGAVGLFAALHVETVAGAGSGVGAAAIPVMLRHPSPFGTCPSEPTGAAVAQGMR